MKISHTIIAPATFIYSYRILMLGCLSVFIFFILGAASAAAQTPGSFSTTWQTDNPGTSKTIKSPSRPLALATTTPSIGKT